MTPNIKKPQETRATASDRAPNPPAESQPVGDAPSTSLSPEHIAEFLMANMPLIRRRISGRLRHEARGVDVDDLCSSVARRVWAAAAMEDIALATDEELLAYILTVADNLAQRRSAEERRRRALIRSLAHTASAATQHTNEDRLELTLNAVIDSVVDPDDRDLLHRRLRGQRCADLARETGRTQFAVRKHWSRLCDRLRCGLWGWKYACLNRPRNNPPSPAFSSGPPQTRAPGPDTIGPCSTGS